MSGARLTLSGVVDALEGRGLVEEVRGDPEVPIRGVSQDSRTVDRGDLFLAWKGLEHDAHDFLASAVEAGAVAAVVERLVPEAPVPQIRVRDGRLAAALAADAVLGSPWRDLRVAGVTGTNGKTTTALLTRHLLAKRGPAVALGTLGLVETDGSVRPGSEGLTTPGPVQISRWLRELADEEVRYVALEASSHALDQRRLDGIGFDVAAFTNLSRDHLDYHADWEGYLRAKGHLVELLKPRGGVVVNADEPAWRGLPRHPGSRISFGLAGGADLQAEDVELHASGARFVLAWEGNRARVEFPLPGGYNVENALAAAGAALLLGMTFELIAEGLGRAPQIPGRLERVLDEPFTVLIDFAHTPDALARVLDVLRPLATGRLIVVFGAGGDRDRSKRPEMGRVATSRADVTLITSDNPRTEDPDAIIDDIVRGLREEGSWERIPDRREAILRALEIAREGDLILLAGKGHERYQVVGREKRPFDERSVVLEGLDGGRAA